MFFLNKKISDVQIDDHPSEKYDDEIGDIPPRQNKLDNASPSKLSQSVVKMSRFSDKNNLELEVHEEYKKEKNDSLGI